MVAMDSAVGCSYGDASGTKDAISGGCMDVFAAAVSIEDPLISSLLHNLLHFGAVAIELLPLLQHRQQPSQPPKFHSQVDHYLHQEQATERRRRSCIQQEDQRSGSQGRGCAVKIGDLSGIQLPVQGRIQHQIREQCRAHSQCRKQSVQEELLRRQILGQQESALLLRRCALVLKASRLNISRLRLPLIFSYSPTTYALRGQLKQLASQREYDFDAVCAAPSLATSATTATATADQSASTDSLPASGTATHAVPISKLYKAFNQIRELLMLLPSTSLLVDEEKLAPPRTYFRRCSKHTRLQEQKRRVAHWMPGSHKRQVQQQQVAALARVFRFCCHLRHSPILYSCFLVFLAAAPGRTHDSATNAIAAMWALATEIDVALKVLCPTDGSKSVVTSSVGPENNNAHSSSISDDGAFPFPSRSDSSDSETVQASARSKGITPAERHVKAPPQKPLSGLLKSTTQRLRYCKTNVESLFASSSVTGPSSACGATSGKSAAVTLTVTSGGQSHTAGDGKEREGDDNRLSRCCFHVVTRSQCASYVRGFISGLIPVILWTYLSRCFLPPERAGVLHILIASCDAAEERNRRSHTSGCAASAVRRDNGETKSNYTGSINNHRSNSVCEIMDITSLCSSDQSLVADNYSGFEELLLFVLAESTTFISTTKRRKSTDPLSTVAAATAAYCPQTVTTDVSSTDVNALGNIDSCAALLESLSIHGDGTCSAALHAQRQRSNDFCRRLLQRYPCDCAGLQVVQETASAQGMSLAQSNQIKSKPRILDTVVLSRDLALGAPNLTAQTLQKLMLRCFACFCVHAPSCSAIEVATASAAAVSEHAFDLEPGLLLHHPVVSPGCGARKNAKSAGKDSVAGSRRTLIRRERETGEVMKASEEIYAALSRIYQDCNEQKLNCEKPLGGESASVSASSNSDTSTATFATATAEARTASIIAEFLPRGVSAAAIGSLYWYENEKHLLTVQEHTIALVATFISTLTSPFGIQPVALQNLVPQSITQYLSNPYRNDPYFMACSIAERKRRHSLVREASLRQTDLFCEKSGVDMFIVNTIDAALDPLIEYGNDTSNRRDRNRSDQFVASARQNISGENNDCCSCGSNNNSKDGEEHGISGHFSSKGRISDDGVSASSKDPCVMKLLSRAVASRVSMEELLQLEVDPNVTGVAKVPMSESLLLVLQRTISCCLVWINRERSIPTECWGLPYGEVVRVDRSGRGRGSVIDSSTSFSSPVCATKSDVDSKTWPCCCSSSDCSASRYRTSGASEFSKAQSPIAAAAACASNSFSRVLEKILSVNVGIESHSSSPKKGCDDGSSAVGGDGEAACRIPVKATVDAVIQTTKGWNEYLDKHHVHQTCPLPYGSPLFPIGLLQKQICLLLLLHQTQHFGCCCCCCCTDDRMGCSLIGYTVDICAAIQREYPCPRESMGQNGLEETRNTEEPDAEYSAHQRCFKSSNVSRGVSVGNSSCENLKYVCAPDNNCSSTRDNAQCALAGRLYNGSDVSGWNDDNGSNTIRDGYGSRSISNGSEIARNSSLGHSLVLEQILRRAARNNEFLARQQRFPRAAWASAALHIVQ